MLKCIQVRLEDCGEYFGAVVSTMLVFNISKLFALLACTRFPISVWWEHPLYDIPRALKKEKRYAFFNLAFGDFPGRAVGLEVIEATDASHASHFDFMQEKGAHELFSRILLKLVKEIPPVDAWVVSNDSYRNRLDSFEFSLDALAEQSVFHLVSPGVTLYKKDDFRELSGHVVEK